MIKSIAGIPNIKAYLAWATICIVWGTTYLAIKVGVTDLPPLLFAGFRWLVAGPLLFMFLLFRKYKLPKGKDFIHIFIVGVMLLGIGNGLVVFGSQWLPSGLTSLILTTLPLWVIGIEGALPIGPTLNRVIVLGVLIGLGGVCVIFSENITQIWETEYFPGIVSLLIAIISWAGGTIYSKYNKISVNVLMGASIQMMIAGVIQTAIGLSLGEFESFYFTPESFLAYAYLTVVASILGYGSFLYAVERLPVSFVSTYTYVNPVIALFLGWLVLNENINLQIILGALVIFIGVGVVRRGSKV